MIYVFHGEKTQKRTQIKATGFEMHRVIKETTSFVKGSNIQEAICQRWQRWFVDG